MTNDVKVLTVWILICAFIAALGTTAVPILYAFYPWRLRPIGRLFMLQSISFALAMDLTVAFAIWTPKNILVLFWINAFVFTFIAGTTTTMAVWLAMMMGLYSKKKGNDNAS